MKYLFFLIIIPFLLIPSAYAEIGKNFDSVINKDGSITWTSHFERILKDDIYQNLIFTNHPNYLQVETANISIRLDTSSCEFNIYNGGLIGNKTPLLIDDIIPYRAINGSNNWNILTQIDEANCVTSWDGDTLAAKKSMIGMGEVIYEYKFLNGKWKTQLKVKNESGLDNRQFGFEQIFNLNRDSIRFAGSERNLDNFDGQTFERTFLENNKAKIIDLLNGHKFNFDIAFDNLNEISIIDTGLNSSQLIFQYFFNQTVILDGQTLIIDPSFSSDNPTEDGYMVDQVDDNDCLDFSVKDNTGTIAHVGKKNVANSWDCNVAYFQWDTSTIPDGSVVNNTKFLFEIVVDTNGVACTYQPMTVDVTTATDQQIFTDIVDGVSYTVSGDSCNTVGTNREVILGDLTNNQANLDVMAGLVNDRFGFGIDSISAGNGANNEQMGHATEEDAGMPDPTLQITYFNGANAVEDLTATEVRANGVDLIWTQPDLNDAIFHSYQLNSTTPHNENVASVVENATTDLSLTVSNLLGSTQYSFLVSLRTDTGLMNTSGNVLNITTNFDPVASFTAGTFNLTAVGTDIRNFKFERIDLNTTALLLNVTYPNSFNSSCNFYFKFAMVNQSHFNLVDVPISPSEDEASFRFEGVDNEIIEVTCQDHNSNVTGDYLITQTSFMILQQIQDFQSGVFGTMGKFGAIDLITVFAVTISMIGFNRINESVGVILSVLMIGGFSIFGLIQWETTFTASLALAVLWAYTNTRKT